MVKVDLHTHSSASLDGGIKPEQYAQALESGLLDVIAITDHNLIAKALELHDAYPDQIIVGEEIMTTVGEVVGLFLTKLVRPGLSLPETIKAIKVQGGLVYIPHPFETVRSGLPQTVLDSLAKDVDIVEVCNGRAIFQNFGPKAAAWTRLNRLAAAASSDAHGFKGLGHTYSSLSEKPTAKNLVELLSGAQLTTGRPPLRTLFYPKAHRLKKRFSL